MFPSARLTVRPGRLWRRASAGCTGGGPRYCLTAVMAIEKAPVLVPVIPAAESVPSLATV